jgi:predicted Ser/Thr protein kinase
LKKDVFGQVSVQASGDEVRILRSAVQARYWARWLARMMLKRESRALLALRDVDGIPRLLSAGKNELSRTYIPGVAMQTGRPADPAYFAEAARLLRRMHRRGVAHNDLAKEPNWLISENGSPAVVDFQMATVRLSRGRWFRILAREDIRHLLKHKRTYCPDHLTRRERNILDNPAFISRLWMATGKKLYLFVTRRLMGWQDREGAFDRDS